MGIREDETVEMPSPVRGKPRAPLRVLGVCAALAGVIGAVAVALSPGLRQRFLATRTPLIAISIDSTPSGADVFIDEESRGRTPTEARLTPGQHVIRIVRVGYMPWRRTFDAAKTRKLAPTLEPLRVATLIVESEPGGADVLLDGERRGTTPIRLSNDEAGAHTVRVADEPIYRAVTRHVQLKARETRRLTVRLTSKLEAFYREQIKEQPAKLGNYTELVHHYLEEQSMEKAVAVTTKALRVLDGAEASSIELRQFYTELDIVCLGRAAGVSDAMREELLEAVLALFGRLAATKPHEPELYLPIVRILERTGRFTRMLEACDEAAQRARVRGVVHVNIAEAYLDRGGAKRAITLLEHATKLRPDHLQAHERLGAAYHHDERYGDALRAYEIAERLSADAPAERRSQLQIEIARLLAAKGDTEGAVARYEKALGLEAPAGRGVEVTRGLIAHYRFDKDASDASGNGRHAENHGATLVAGGKFGSAFSFDGADDYVSIPSGVTRGLASATFALWVKTTQSKAKPRGSYWTNPALLGVATAAYGSGDLALMIEKGNVAYFHGLPPEDRDMSWFSEKSVNDDRWHHIALVNAGPLVLLYVDGRLARGEAFRTGGGTKRLGVRSDTSSGRALGSAPFFIGATNVALGRRTCAGCFYRGLIDDVRIWNRALRAAEVAAICTKAK